MFNASKSRSTILLKVSNCFIFFIGGSSKFFNLGDTILIEISNYSVSSVRGFSKLFNLGDTVLICI